jgi:hypothetical protein
VDPFVKHQVEVPPFQSILEEQPIGIEAEARGVVRLLFKVAQTNPESEIIRGFAASIKNAKVASLNIYC